MISADGQLLRRMTANDLAGVWPRRASDAHKGDHGHVLLIGGNTGMGGALILAAQAALRVGAGLVSAFSRRDTLQALLIRQPECMGLAVDEEAVASAAVQRAEQRANALVLGPGMSDDSWAQCWLTRYLDDSRPRVVDADALNDLANSPRRLSNAVLTPHPGEAARLLSCSTAAIQSDRPAALAALVERYASVIVLKGAGTLVAGPGSRTYLIEAGNPGMAVGGMGDLLAGIIGGLLAQGFGPLDAARWGALVHAVAGDDAASSGQRGLLPSDVLEHLRRRCN